MSPSESSLDAALERIARLRTVGILASLVLVLISWARVHEPGRGPVELIVAAMLFCAYLALVFGGTAWMRRGARRKHSPVDR
jgi:hypothetical protein